jgi:hypothetical protein
MAIIKVTANNSSEEVWYQRSKDGSCPEVNSSEKQPSETMAQIALRKGCCDLGRSLHVTPGHGKPTAKMSRGLKERQ